MDYPALDRLEQLANSLHGLQSRVGERVEQLRAQPVEVESDSGAVRVVVDHAGRVDRVEIGARAMRYAAEQLGREITETISRAQAEASTRLRDSMREVLGSAADDYELS